MQQPVKNTYLSPQATENPRQFPSISQPKIVGCFSLNGNREYLADARNCKYVYKNYNRSKQVHYDLNDGIEDVIRKPESSTDEKASHLLEFILRNKQTLRQQASQQNRDKILSPDFVCFRGLLRLIMCTPYEQRDGWIILATKYKGTIYLCARDTEKQTQERNNQTEATKRILSYGFKFEQYILTGKGCIEIRKKLTMIIQIGTHWILDNPSEKPPTNVPVNEAEEFCCMFSTTLNGQRILYGAEMDGIESNDTQDLDNADLNQFKFVELKVKLREQNHRQKQNYHRFKLRNWWCQSFLVNIKKIIVGTRTTDGIVNELSTVDVKDIPKQCQVCNSIFSFLCINNLLFECCENKNDVFAEFLVAVCVHGILQSVPEVCG